MMPSIQLTVGPGGGVRALVCCENGCGKEFQYAGAASMDLTGAMEEAGWDLGDGVCPACSGRPTVALPEEERKDRACDRLAAILVGTPAGQAAVLRGRTDPKR